MTPRKQTEPVEHASEGAARASGEPAVVRLRRLTLPRAATAWVRLRRRRERDAALARLSADEDPAIAAVGRALTAAVNEPGPAERAWIERIEAIRSELGASSAVIRPAPTEAGGEPARRRGRGTSVSRLALEVSKPARWGRVLLNLTRELRPHRCLELGTCIGLSTAYQAAGLELSGKDGSVTTIELNAPRVELARDNLERLRLSSRVDPREGSFRKALPEVLREVGELGFAFIDGNHKRGPTLRYFEHIDAHLEKPGVILFDDITWSEGMREAWAEISVDPRVALAIDLHGLGLCVVRGGNGVPHKLDVFLHP